MNDFMGKYTYEKKQLILIKAIAEIFIYMYYTYIYIYIDR